MLRLGTTLLLIAPCPAHLAAAWTWQGVSEAVWHSNITNSDRPADRLSALQWRTELSGAVNRSLPGGNFVSTGLQIELDLWPRYEGLDSISFGPSFALSHKFGLGAQAWVIGAAASGDWVTVREHVRSGLAGELRLEVRKRWGDSWQSFLGSERTRYEARQLAFTHSGRENYLRVEYQLNPVWRAAVELRQRVGIVVSYTTPPRPDLVLAGKVLTLVDTFERETPLLAYYFPADTQSASLELTRTMGPAASAYLKFEYGETTHFALRYLNQRSTLGLVWRF